MMPIPGANLTISGPDASPVIIPLREFGLENQRMLPYLPQEPIVQSAPRKRLLLSWWDREVNIWRISKTSSSTQETYDSDSEAEERGTNRKLVAKIVIKGEANISSASITPDGSLLAVSTPGEIKIFRLKSRTLENADYLRVTKLEVPSKLSIGGARSLLFSPDGHWLVVVRRDSHIVIARVLDYNTDSIRLLPILSKVERQDRRTEKRVLPGGLGAYDRTITRMAFSSDSRILAVADLAGYIDTWVLEGREDLTQAGDHLPTLRDASFPSSPDSSDSDEYEDEDQDEGQRPTVILGQHWIRNPSASLIPKLPSPAVVLAFRPTPVAEAASQSIAIPTPHPTRHNPYPHLQDLPRGEDRLLAVSATGSILEFGVLQGALSAWSRQNPMAKYPKEFLGLRDQAMGCIWDLGNSQDRLWLYGSNWIWMFDLSRNFSSEASLQERSLTNGYTNSGPIRSDQSRPSKKRKTGHAYSSTTSDLRKGTSGAGSRVPDEELVTGISRKYQKVVYDKGNFKNSLLDYRSGPTNVDTDELDEDMGADGMDLALRRTQHGNDAAFSNGDRQVATGDSDGDADTSPHWWHTYKYRPIMGIVPIDGDAGLEVVLVERPLWEMDLPPRYYGDQEWEKPGL
jgi:U3 small nucleolar RNA-associated protein 4